MSGEFLEVRIELNKVRVFGDLRLNTLSYLTAALFQVINRSGYKDVVIDLSNISSLTNSALPPLAAYLRSLTRNEAVDFTLYEPRNSSVHDKVVNLGLAHYISHRLYQKPRLKSSDPALIQFMNHDEREVAVDKVMNSALRTAKLDRQHVAALDWAVNEITDNVLTHSESKVGGFLICGRVPHTNIIEFTVADAGIGVSRSLRIVDESEAVERAVQEGVTRNKQTNQGNGLYGTYRLSLVSRGVFVLKSKHGNLFVTKNGDVHVRRDSVPYNGTFVVCQIDCDNPDLIEQALVFSGRPHSPAFDYIERNHESTDRTIVAAKDICKTFGSRQSGSEARQYIQNVLGAADGSALDIDFSDVHVISSSFADEVFGKIFVEIGPMRFMRTIRVVNAVPTVEGLIDRAITLRSKTGL